MQFPSLQSLADGAWRTFRRFPIAILLAAGATGLGIRWTHLNEHRHVNDSGPWNGAPPAWYWNAILSSYLGMLLSVAVTKWVEKRRERQNAGRGGVRGDRQRMIGLQIGVIILAGAYYWSLPSTTIGTQTAIRTVVLALGLHWLIAVIGFRSGEVNGFWIFNKRLFLRFLTTYLYVAVLMTGVVLALLAIDKLFNITIEFEVPAGCSWVIGGLFGVWFFLGGFPGSYENPADISDYPKGLKTFTQYILLSLVMIYLLILYAYLFRIIFIAHWPSGWVGWMVMAFAVAGILSLLLIYPLRNKPDSGWIRGYSRFYYLALLPLIALLFVAIYKRVAPYGITEQRYFLLVLALWLLFITGYFLLSRAKDIRLVPLSLCILAFLSVWGPWGAFRVSLLSQTRRLERLLAKNGLMQDGKVVTGKAGVHVSFQDRKAISSVLDYLVAEHGYRTLQPLFHRNLDSVFRADSVGAISQSESIMRVMNVEYTSPWLEEDDTAGQAAPLISQSFQCYPAAGTAATSTGGAAEVATFGIDLQYSDSCRVVALGRDQLKICPDTARKQLRFSLLSGGGESVADLMPVVRRVLANHADEYELGPDQFNLPLSGGALRGKLLLTDMEGQRTDSLVRLLEIRGMLLFSRK